MSDWITRLHQLPPSLVEKSAVMAVLDESLVSVTGDDAARLLQGQLTADMVSLTTGNSVGAALCNPKGRVLALMHILRTDEGFLLRTAADNQQTLVETLRKYGVFFKVQIQPLTDSGVLLATDARALPDLDSLYRRVRADGSAEIWTSLTALQTWLQGETATTGDEHWRSSQVHCGEPSIYALASGEFLPHALSLDLSGMISFNKGCYTGQEIVARTHYRGKSKRRLAAISVAPVQANPGDKLVSSDGTGLADLVTVARLADRTELLLSAVDPLDETASLFLQGQRLDWRRIPLPWDAG